MIRRTIEGREAIKSLVELMDRLDSELVISGLPMGWTDQVRSKLGR